MKRKTFSIIIIFIFLTCVGLWPLKSVHARQSEVISEKISIDKAVKIALINNQDYKIASYQEKEAKEKVNAAWGQLMPILESEVSVLRQKAENGFMSLSNGENDIKFVQLKFGLNPGIFYNSLKLAKESLTAAREETRKTEAAIEYSVIESYFKVLLATEIINLRQESLTVLKSNLKDVENMYRTGTVPKFELLQAQVQLKSQEPLYLSAKNDYNIALDLFNYNLGFDELKYIPDDAVLKEESYKEPAGDKKSKLENLTAVALRNRPEIIQLETSRKITEHSRNINSSYYLWPTFSVGGYYGKTQYLPNPVDTGAPPGMGLDLSGITGTDQWQNTWQVLVAATYRWGSILPTDPTRAQEREENLKLKEAEEALLKLKRLIGISIRSNYSKLNTSYLTIKSQKENVITAEEGLRIAKESYKAGVIKNSDLLSAELSLTNARTGYINAVYDYYVSLAELKKEIGIEDERVIMEEIN